MVKQNKLKAEREIVSLTIQIPAKKYRKLQEIARLCGQESLTFINGQADFPKIPCNDCPAKVHHRGSISGHISDCNGECKANFLTWLFNEGV
jgi:hypothetical protein